MKLGESIRNARRKTGVTQAELARQIGCTEGYVAHIEHGRSLPSELKLLHICDVLGLDKRRAIRLRQQEKAHDQARPYYEENREETFFFRDGHRLTRQQMDYAIKVIRAVENDERVRNAIDLLIGED